jgi:hypothetical protein
VEVPDFGARECGTPVKHSMGPAWQAHLLRKAACRVIRRFFSLYPWHKLSAWNANRDSLTFRRQSTWRDIDTALTTGFLRTKTCLQA